jgi:hypothetical protein
MLWARADVPSPVPQRGSAPFQRRFWRGSSGPTGRGVGLAGPTHGVCSRGDRVRVGACRGSAWPMRGAAQRPQARGARTPLPIAAGL